MMAIQNRTTYYCLNYLKKRILFSEILPAGSESGDSPLSRREQDTLAYYF